MNLTAFSHAVMLAFGWRRAAIAFGAGAASALAMAPINAWPILFVTLPAVTGGGLVFAGVLLVLLLAVLVERRSLFVDGLQTRRNRRTFLVVCGIASLLVAVGVMWQGAVKASWRPIARGGDMTSVSSRAG